MINKALELTGSQMLYGGPQVIRDGRGRDLAETLEIVPLTTGAAAAGRQRGSRPVTAG
jgi:hypothetical protein